MAHEPSDSFPLGTFLLELATLFLMAACCVGLPVVMAS
jgi:hypothetical protein